MGTQYALAEGMNGGAVGRVSEPMAGGRAGWLEQETAETCLDPTGRGRAVDTAVAETQSLPLDLHAQPHTQSPGKPTKEVAETVRLGRGWECEDRLSSKNSVSTWICHGNST